jgi:hypothetical protein
MGRSCTSSIIQQAFARLRGSRRSITKLCGSIWTANIEQILQMGYPLPGWGQCPIQSPELICLCSHVAALRRVIELGTGNDRLIAS